MLAQLLETWKLAPRLASFFVAAESTRATLNRESFKQVWGQLELTALRFISLLTADKGAWVSIGTVRCWKCSLSPIFHATFPRLSRSTSRQAKQVSSPVFSCLPSSAEQKTLHGGPLPPLELSDWLRPYLRNERGKMQETDRATSVLLST